MGKYLAGIIAFIALAWTVYVGVNIASFRESVSPYSVFPAREPVLVANRPFNYELIAQTNALPQNDLLKSVFSHPERVQHIYVGAHGKTVLLERSKPWTIELAKQFFRKNGLSAELVSSRKLKLSNGWYALFDDNFLVLSAADARLAGDNLVHWNYLDKKSSYSLVNWDGAYPYIENVYHKADGTILYVSAENTSGQHLADDQDAFSEVIPRDLESYTFYEKEYLRSLGEADRDFFTWINSGAIVLKSKGKTCVVTDFLPSQDPIAVLGDKVEESSLNEAKTKALVKNSKLPQVLLPAGNYFIEVFNNRVYLAQDKSAIDELIGVYESGKTLTQDVEKYSSLFGSAPRKVSFREISGSEHRTISLLANSRHTVVRKLSTAAVADNKPANEIAPLRIDGGIDQLLPVNASNFIFVLSKNGRVYGVDNNDIRWKIDLGSKPVSPAVFTANNDELLIVTSNEVHRIKRDGSNQVTPSENGEILAATAFSWKGQQQLCVVERNGLRIIPASGRKNSLSYNFSNALTQAVAWVSKGELRISVLNGNKLVTFSADRKRKLKEAAARESGILVKTDQGPFVYELVQGGAVQKTDWNGVQTAAISGVRKMEPHYDNKHLLFYTGSSLTVTDLSGAVVAQTALPFSDAEKAGFIDEPGSKTAIAALDGIANRAVVLGRNGGRLSADAFEGSSVIALQRRSNGSLLLVSQMNGYLVRYVIR